MTGILNLQVEFLQTSQIETPVNTHITDLLHFFLFCFGLRMKLCKASLAGKISNSERNFRLS